MKKIIRITGIVLVIFALLFGFLYFRISGELSKMAPVQTGLIVEDVYGIMDSYVNIYLVKTKEGYIAFDAGNDREKIFNEMKKLGISPSEVKAVFLTHTDEDHRNAVPLFKDATLYISKAEEVMITGKTPRFLCIHNKLGRKPLLLDDGQTVTVGGTRVKGILTPGHTPGSICFLVNDRFLFTGDTLSLINGKAQPFNELFNMDTEREKKSLKLLTGLKGVTHILTAHYGVSDDYTKAFAHWK
jgi:glyoxylase-like metal-dependent hydrolase (beta-lactamase superfamily II)